MPEDYIHRIGRTGRAEATGDAITFISGAERDNLRSIEKHTGRAIDTMEVAGFDKPALAEALGKAKKRSNPSGHRSRAKSGGQQNNGGRGKGQSGRGKGRNGQR